MSERTRLQAIEEHLNYVASQRNEHIANHKSEAAAQWSQVAFLGEIAYQLAVMNERATKPDTDTRNWICRDCERIKTTRANVMLQMCPTCHAPMERLAA